MRVGAIDIGSNSIRLLVAEASAADGATGLKTLARAGEPCRLARGLEATGRIEPELAEKATEIAIEFLQRARTLGAKRVVIGATAALREAANGQDVAAEIGRATGLPVRILSGDEEAQLIYRSVVLGLGSGLQRSACLVFDLGGGSTEVVSGLGGNPGRWVSLPFGAVTLTEKYLTSNPPKASEVESLEAGVRQQLMHHCALFPERTPALVGVGGTITVLALMDRGLTSYDPSFIEGWAIEPGRLAELIERMLSAPTALRRTWPAMGEGRADIVAAGALVVRQLIGRFPAPALHCSTQGLRYGLARLAAEEVVSGADSADPVPPH